MFENIRNAITHLPMNRVNRLWRNLGGRIPSCPRHVPHDAVAHCTFSSYGRLEAERVNQFCWNLVYSSKLGPQWQSPDQILKFLKFKMADDHHVWKYYKCQNSPTNRPTETQLGWSHSIMSRHVPHNLVAMATTDRCLATAHWTFCSYGRLETECVNQFWKNLVQSSCSMLGPERQSRD